MHPKPEEESLPPPASSNNAEVSAPGVNVPVDTNLIQLDGFVCFLIIYHFLPVFGKKIIWHPVSSKL